MSDSSQPITLKAKQILLPEGFVRDHAVVIKNGIIHNICPFDQLVDCHDFVDLGNHLLVPGLIDLQVNGGGGVLFNNAPDESSVHRIVAAHRSLGTTSLLPTVISDSKDIIERCIDSVSEAMKSNQSVLGIHLEGPFFNRNKRGVHQKEFIRTPAPGDTSLFSKLPTGKTLVTLAPEKVPASFISDLVARGVIIAAGHSNANYEETIDAIDAGLTGFTHLFNAMPPISGRKPGLVTAALLSNSCYCGLIADLLHVHPASIELARRSIPTGYLFFVSDAMATTGSYETTFSLYGETIHEEDGGLRNNEGKLAGSAIALIDAVRIAVNSLHFPLDEALRMASVYPANFIGIEQQCGTIKVGLRADLLCLDAELNVIETWVAGSPNNQNT